MEIARTVIARRGLLVCSYEFLIVQSENVKFALLDL